MQQKHVRQVVEIEDKETAVVDGVAREANSATTRARGDAGVVDGHVHLAILDADEVGAAGDGLAHVGDVAVRGLCETISDNSQTLSNARQKQ